MADEKNMTFKDTDYVKVYNLKGEIIRYARVANHQEELIFKSKEKENKIYSWH